MTPLTVEELSETYEIAAALGEPFDAPVGATVYLVTIKRGPQAYLELSDVAPNRAEAENQVLEFFVHYLVEIADRVYHGEGYWLNVKCPQCGASDEIAPCDIVAYRGAIRRVYAERYPLTYSVSDLDFDLQADTLAEVECFGCKEDGFTSTWHIDLASSDMAYLCTYEEAEKALKKLDNQAEIKKRTLGRRWRPPLYDD